MIGWFDDASTVLVPEHGRSKFLAWQKFIIDTCSPLYTAWQAMDDKADIQSAIGPKLCLISNSVCPCKVEISVLVDLVTPVVTGGNIRDGWVQQVAGFWGRKTNYSCFNNVHRIQMKVMEVKKLVSLLIKHQVWKGIILSILRIPPVCWDQASFSSQLDFPNSLTHANKDTQRHAMFPYERQWVHAEQGRLMDEPQGSGFTEGDWHLICSGGERQACFCFHLNLCGLWTCLEENVNLILALLFQIIVRLTPG